MSANSCKHPLKAFKIGVNPKTGKDKLRVTSYGVDHVELRADGKYYNVFSSEVSAFSKAFTDWQEIPCGQCIGCRLQYSRDWANRCCLEMQNHQHTYFVTLTYDNDHLPTEYITHPDTGEVNFPVHSLIKKDLQDFMKELRYYYDKNKIRYYGCGEYGDESARPHYHIIIFGLDLDDLKLYKRVTSKAGTYNYYNSETIDKAWKHKGYCVVSEATWESIAYTARYVTKKLKGTAASFYDDFHLVPEFVLMSRKPGIGRDYYERFKDSMFDCDELFFSTPTGGRSSGIPRYFKKLLEQENEQYYNIVKEHNKEQAEISKKIKMTKTSLNYLDYLETEEINLKKSIRSLKRNGV